MTIKTESNEEREVFDNMQSIDKGFDTEYAKTMTELMDELAIARMLIRELGDRLAKLEKPWVDLTKEECFELCVKHKDNPFSLLVAVQEKLWRKNT